MARATPLFGNEGPFGAQLGLTPYKMFDSGCWVDPLLTRMRFCALTSGIASDSAGSVDLMAVHFWRIRKDGGYPGRRR